MSLEYSTSLKKGLAGFRPVRTESQLGVKPKRADCQNFKIERPSRQYLIPKKSTAVADFYSRSLANIKTPIAT